MGNIQWSESRGRWTESRAKLAEILKGYRLECGYTQAEAAKIIGISQGEVSRIEKADRGLEIDDLARIAVAYNRTLSILVEDYLK